MPLTRQSGFRFNDVHSGAVYAFPGDRQGGGAGSDADFLAEIITQAQVAQNNPDDAAATTFLLGARHRLAKTLAGLPDDQLEGVCLGAAGKAISSLIAAGLRNASRLVGDPQERAAQQQWAADMAADLGQDWSVPGTAGRLIVAMLYLAPHELPARYDLEHLGRWLVADYLAFMFRPPVLFWDMGEADAYFDVMRAWLDYLHAHILSQPHDPFWRGVGEVSMRSMNCIPLFFNYKSLKEINVHRAQIMEAMLQGGGHATDYTFPPRAPDRHKIRLGVLAAHYAPQTETYSMLAAYGALDRSRFEIILFTLGATGTPLERQCMSRADRFQVLPSDLQKQVNAIRECDLDVIIIGTNVAAVTNGVALLALHRLARVQIIGYICTATSGMRHSDYYISGTFQELPDGQSQYTEKLVLIDGVGFCVDRALYADAGQGTPVTRAELGIPSDAIVFTSGANFHKIIPELEDAWARILAGVPNSHLLLYPFNPNWSNAYPVQLMLQRLGATLARHGVGIERVLIFPPSRGRGDVVERIKLADIYLDGFPFTGLCSLLDPLNIGMPVVTMDGTTIRSREGASLFRELQIPDLIAADPQGYVDLAVKLGTDTEFRRRKGEQINAAMAAGPKFLDTTWYGGEMARIIQELTATLQRPDN